jgi:hypothetical protein
VSQIRIDLEPGEHDRLSEVKDERGLTWRGVLLEWEREVAE